MPRRLRLLAMTKKGKAGDKSPVFLLEKVDDTKHAVLVNITARRGDGETDCHVAALLAMTGKEARTWPNGNRS